MIGLPDGNHVIEILRPAWHPIATVLQTPYGTDSVYPLNWSQVGFGTSGVVKHDHLAMMERIL